MRNCDIMKITFTPPQIMGILNLTDDSFYDGGKHFRTAKAVEHALWMITEDVDIIDIGAESTRPGSKKIKPEEEIKRLVPVIKELKDQDDITISIDTYKAAVAKAAIEAGADIINDIYALRYEPEMVKVLKANPQVKLVLMHMQGTPATMQDNPQYNDVVAEIMAFFTERIAFCEQNGIAKERLILDPGIGFGKTAEHNITIIKELHQFTTFGLPVLLGASRKSFISSIYDSTPDERLIGTLACTVAAGLKGVDIVRVHDVLEHRQMIETLMRVI